MKIMEWKATFRMIQIDRSRSNGCQNWPWKTGGRRWAYPEGVPLWGKNVQTICLWSHAESPVRRRISDERMADGYGRHQEGGALP